MSREGRARIESGAVDVAAVGAVAALLVVPYVEHTTATILDTAALLYGAGPTVIAPMLACALVAFVLALRARAPAGWLVASLPVVGVALAVWRAALAAAATPLPGGDVRLAVRQLEHGEILFDAAARLRAVSSSAAVALALASWGFVFHARRRAPTAPAPRRLAALVLGGAAIPVLFSLRSFLRGSMGDDEIWIVALPAALGVAGVVLAGRPAASAGEASGWAGETVMAAVLAASATLAMAIAVAASWALYPHGTGGPTPAGSSVELFGDALRGGLPFAAAPLVAGLVAWPFRGLRGLGRRSALALGGACAILLLGPLAIARGVHRASSDVVARAAALEPSLPADLTLIASAPDGGPCGDLIEDRLLVLGRERVRLGGRELGGPSVLDTDAGCDAAAGGVGPLFVAADPGVSFERLGCVLAARGRLAAPLLEDASPGAEDWTQIRARCTFRWVARAPAEEGGALTCATRLLPLARCLQPGLHSTESHFEVLVRSNRPYELRRRQGRATLSTTEVAPSDLSRVTGEAWRAHPDHLDPNDAGYDKIVLRVEPGVSTDEVLRATDGVLRPTRARARRSRDDADYGRALLVDGPVFEVGFGLLEPDAR